MFRHHRQFLMLFFLLSCSDRWIDAAQDSESVVVVKPRMFAGEDVPKGKWPFNAEIRWNDNDNKAGHFCGGAVLNDDTIITSAHCLKFTDGLTPDKIRVYLGEVVVNPLNRDSLYEVAKFIPHPSTEGKTLGIALVKLSRKIDFNQGLIAKVCLPGPGVEPDTCKCLVLGWGVTVPNQNSEDMPAVLQQVNMPIVPCIGEHPHIICAGFYDKLAGGCAGDDGAPLLCPSMDDPHTYLLFGIFAIRFAACGQAPGGFFKVADFLEWIQQNAEA